MRTIDHLDIAITLRNKRGRNLPHEVRRLIGGPFSLKQIEDITGLNRKYYREQYRDNDRPGGRLNPDTLDDIAHLRYQVDTKMSLDTAAIARVLCNGTSPRVLARLLGMRPGDVEKYVAPNYEEEDDGSSHCRRQGSGYL